jgi:hypothetical protein
MRYLWYSFASKDKKKIVSPLSTQGSSVFDILEANLKCGKYSKIKLQNKFVFIWVIFGE